MQYYYQQTEFPGEDGAIAPLFTVGHDDHDGNWISESDHPTSEEAADRVAYLNGGGRPQTPDLDAALAQLIRSKDELLEACQQLNTHQDQEAKDLWKALFRLLTIIEHSGMTLVPEMQGALNDARKNAHAVLVRWNQEHSCR